MKQRILSYRTPLRHRRPVIARDCSAALQRWWWGGGGQAGHKALHTCTSWYAYAAMSGGSIEMSTMTHSVATIQSLHQFLARLYSTVGRPMAAIPIQATLLMLALLGQADRLGIKTNGEEQETRQFYLIGGGRESREH